MISAGVTEVVITPPIGVELSGYGPNLNRYSTDIHDPLVAQALVLDDEQTRLAMVTLDVMMFTRSFANRVREEVASRTAIPPGHVLIAASHSHTAPTFGPTREWGMPDAAYVEMAARHVTGAVAASAHKLTPVRLRLGTSEHPDLAWNRTGLDLVDPAVTVLVAEHEDGFPLAILVHYACHPVMLGPRSEISADYPGALRRFLKETYPRATVLFLNGAAGDIDPESNRLVWGNATFQDVEQAGISLGKVAMIAIEAATPIAGAPLRVVLGEMTLPYQVPTLETARVQARRYATEIGPSIISEEKFEDPASSRGIPRFWLRYWRSLEARLLAGEIAEADSFELQVIYLGTDLILIAIPAEVYTEQGLQIKALSPNRTTLAACYANDMCGYIPSRQAFHSGSYAATLAAAVFDRVQFKDHVADILVDSVKRLLSS